MIPRAPKHRTRGYRPQNPEHRAVIEALVSRHGEPLETMGTPWRYYGGGPFAETRRQSGTTYLCLWCGKRTYRARAHWPGCHFTAE